MCSFLGQLRPSLPSVSLLSRGPGLEIIVESGGTDYFPRSTVGTFHLTPQPEFFLDRRQVLQASTHHAKDVMQHPRAAAEHGQNCTLLLALVFLLLLPPLLWPCYEDLVDLVSLRVALVDSIYHPVKRCQSRISAVHPMDPI